MGGSPPNTCTLVTSLPLSAALRLDFLPDTKVSKGLKGRAGSAMFGSPGFLFYQVVAWVIPQDATGKVICWWALGGGPVFISESPCPGLCLTQSRCSVKCLLGENFIVIEQRTVPWTK